MGNNNTINIYQLQHEEDDDKKKNHYSLRDLQYYKNC